MLSCFNDVLDGSLIFIPVGDFILVRSVLMLLIDPSSTDLFTWKGFTGNRRCLGFFLPVWLLYTFNSSFD